MFRPFALAVVLAATAAAPVFAQGRADPAVTARKAHMQLYAHNIGILGGMARGRAEYDATAAAAAAGNLAALAQLDQSSYWTPGTDSEAMAESRALPALWENIPDAIAKGEAMATASIALAAVAGDGLEAMTAGLGPVGASCGACHELYQKSNN